MNISQSFKSAVLAGLAGAVFLGGSALGQEFTFSVESETLEGSARVSEVYARLTGDALDYCEGLQAVIAAGPSSLAACHRDVVGAVVERIGDRALSEHHERVQDQQTGLSYIASL